MKKYFHIVIILFLFAVSSCQTRVVDQLKPMQNNSFELYQKYSIQTNDGKTAKVKVLKQDDQNIYGKTNKDEDVTIQKNEIRQVKKANLLGSIGIAAAAVLALIFIPI